MPSEYRINTQGYYRDESKVQFPNTPAFYFVYRASFNAVERTCILKQLLYIGETDNLYVTCNEQSFKQTFIKELNDGEDLFYTIATTDYDKSIREEIVQALIYEVRPLLNAHIERPATRTIVLVEGNRHAFVPVRIDSPSF